MRESFDISLVTRWRPWCISTINAHTYIVDRERGWVGGGRQALGRMCIFGLIVWTCRPVSNLLNTSGPSITLNTDRPHMGFHPHCSQRAGNLQALYFNSVCGEIRVGVEGMFVRPQRSRHIWPVVSGGRTTTPDCDLPTDTCVCGSDLWTL